MARFKFGKNKKRDGSEGSVKSSVDFPRYSNGASETSSNHYPPTPPSQAKDPHAYSVAATSAFNPDTTASTSDTVNHHNPGSSTFGTPASFKTPGQEFDSTLDPKNSKAPTSRAPNNNNANTMYENDHEYEHNIDDVDNERGSSLSPWKRHKLFNSPFPRYRHAASTFSSEKNEIYLMGGLKEGSVFGDTWKITPQLDDSNNLVFTTKNVEIANNTNPPARVGHSSVLCGNAFIIYGGDTVDTDFNGFPDNNFYLFNINNNKYTVPSHILNKPHGRYGHTIGVIALNNSSSRLYLFGGQLENDVFNDLFYFELNTFKSPKARWETVEPLNNFKPPPLTNHSMCVHKNRIYVFGGVYNNEKVSNDLWCFDAIINKWTQVTTSGAIPSPVNEHSACLVNDKMYVYGGNDFSGTIYDSLYVLDLHSLVWSKLIENDDISFFGPGPRCGHSITYLQSFKKLIIMGGDKNDYIDSNPNNFDTYEEFNGQEIGTMIYELDLLSLDNFLSDKPTKGKINVLKKIAPSSKKDAIQEEGAPLNGSNTLVDQNGKDREGYHQSHVRSFSAGPDDDFRTPNASPSRTKGTNNVSAAVETTAALAAGGAAGVGAGVAAIGAENYLNQTNDDKFVDFENETINSKPATTFLPPPSIYDEKQEKKVSNNQTFHNGHASFLENYDYHEGDAHGHNNEHAPLDITEVDDTEEEEEEERIMHTGPKTTRSLNNGSGTRIRDPTPTKSPNVVESAEVKKIVTELTSELNNLKNSTTVQINEASAKISNLETENQTLISENEQLKAKNEQYLNFDNEIKTYQTQISERDVLINDLKNDTGDDGTPKSISELNRYKLERLELNNKLVYLEQENFKLSDKMEKFEPFMNNQIADLSNFQKVIKAQEEKIASLSNQVKDQEDLQKDVLDWKHKFESLEVEYNNYKSIHNDDDDIVISDEETEETEALEPPHAGGADSSTARSIISTATGRRSKRDISSHLENLVHLWNANTNKASANTSITSDSQSKEIDPIVNKLQTQVDELLTISKEQQAGSATEINTLRKELTEKLQALKKFETNYRDALQSVNNTSKALDSTNLELDKQKELAKKLVKENEELKLYQKASKRASSRNATPITTIQEDAEAEGTEEEPKGEHEDINSAHFNMKIQDLQADLFIMKQERDQLKDDVTTLKKKLYLASQRQ